ncbi:protein DpdG [Sneathiella sp.]|uniref:protein DpdG n=1 Tax=Sneathiella sp. TaxID=1964365 RepID=UPI0035644FBE
MSILNMTNDGLFNVLIVLVRALVSFGPKPRSELLKACGEDLVMVESRQLNNTLTRWTELGLFEVVTGNVAIAEGHRAALGKPADVAEARLPKIVRMIALAPENNARFWGSEGNKSADLSRGLSWILAQNIYTIDTSSHAKIQLLENDQIPDLSQRIFGNDTRWNGLRTWMVYLGFGRTGSQVTVDPTDALRDALSDIFVREAILPAAEFVSRAADILPVLDGGEYRKQMEAVLNPAQWSAPAEGRISMSLSRAIQRLDREGLIATQQKSDSEDGITLQGSSTDSWREMTHIRRLPLKRAK